ncbi:MAG: GDSL-type esterase/lipase family protein [Bacteroidota bacterium]
MNTKRTNALFPISLLLWLLGGSALAQSFDFRDAKYAFIPRDSSRIEQFGDHSLEHFFHMLDNLREAPQQQVRILHLGDSHVQGGFYTGRLRKLWQGYPGFGKGARGFLFPFKLARTNNPPNFRVRYKGDWEKCRNTQRDTVCLIGLAGVSVTTHDPEALIKLYCDTTGGHFPYYFNKVRIYHPVQDSAFQVYALDKYGYPVDAVPDTSQRGFSEIRFDEYQDTLRLAFRQYSDQQDHFLLQGISLESDSGGIIYHSGGQNGADVRDYRFRSPNLLTHLPTLRPDLIILSVGTNDAYPARFDADRFFADYDTLLTTIRTVAPHASILLTTPGDHYRSRRYPSRNPAKAAAVILRLGEKHGLAVWDFYTLMGGYQSIDRWKAAGLSARDRVHFSRNGYYMQAHLLFNAMINAYREHHARQAHSH